MSNKTSIDREYYSSRKTTSFLTISLVRDGALFAWIVIYFTAVSLLFSDETDALNPSSLFWQLAVSSFFLLGVFLQISSRIPIRRLIAAAAPMIPILVWIMVSITWSNFPDISARRAVRLTMEMATAIMFAAAYRDQYKLLRVIYLSFAFITILDVIFLAVPDISFTPIGYAGVHYHKNTTGYLCLFALPIFSLASIDRRIFPSTIFSIALALCCLLLLALSLAKTSIVLVPICFALTIGIISIKRAGPLIRSAMASIILAMSALAVLFIETVGINALLKDTTGDPTITGRSQIWEYAMSLFWQSPITGKGYGGVWNVGATSVLEEKYQGTTFILVHAHNGYIQILSELGVVGAILLTLFIVAVLVRLLRRIRYVDTRRIIFVALYTFFAIFLEDISGSSIFLSGSEIWLYFLLVTQAAIFITPRTSENILPTTMLSRH